MGVPVNPIDPESELHPTKPLEFWKTNRSRFPILSQIAEIKEQITESVAASSGSIERVFSTASDIMSAKRNGIKPDLFDNLMFIKCNASHAPNSQSKIK
jgi:hypothetical protein